MIKKAFVTGARGFVGANLINHLKVLGIPYVRYDALDGNYLHQTVRLSGMMAGCDFVFHLAANADIQKGWDNPTRDLEVNTIGTSNVLCAMRENGIKRIGFASSSAVYGETINPSENCPWPVQTSLYGASKVAGEALIQAYAEGQGFEAYIFRYVPLLGEGYRHGHVYDFVGQLLSHPDFLTVRGGGSQRKSYLYVGDCINAMFHLVKNRATGVWNLCTNDSQTVNYSIRQICEAMNLDPRLDYTGGRNGWVGDAPNLTPSPEKLYASGWKPTTTIPKAMKLTVEWIIAEAAKNKEFFK